MCRHGVFEREMEEATVRLRILITSKIISMFWLRIGSAKKKTSFFSSMSEMSFPQRKDYSSCGSDLFSLLISKCIVWFRNITKS